MWMPLQAVTVSIIIIDEDETIVEEEELAIKMVISMYK